MDEQELFAQIAALRGQLPQWQDDGGYGYNVSKVFAGPKSLGEMGNPGQWEAFQHKLNLKEQEAERLEEIRRRILQQGGR
jgi:hypothetical protein